MAEQTRSLEDLKDALKKSDAPVSAAVAEEALPEPKIDEHGRA